MKKVFKPLGIIGIGIIAGLGFYGGVQNLRALFLDEFIAFVHLNVSDAFEATRSQYVPVVAQVSGAVSDSVTDAGVAIAETVGEVAEKTANTIDQIELFKGEQVVEEIKGSLVIRDDRTRQTLPSRIRDTLTFQTVEVPDIGKAIVADLDGMKLHTYENGKLVKEYPLGAKGKPGSPWETPAGEYEILYKTENHFSSIGEVNMPYSMQFFGNFFIHGWPTYPDGTPVEEGYSGGCIRMEEPYIEEVYEFVDLGTTVFVVGGASTQKSGEYIDKGIGLSRVTSDAFLVADLDTGEVILERNTDEIFPIASLTKLMTALVSLEAVNQFTVTTISQEAVDTYGYQGNLQEGEKIKVQDLIFPLLLTSSNDAAEAIAEHAGRDYFMKLMNQKADSIGLIHTTFEDPSGLSKNNVSTAEDLFRLAQYIYKSKRYIFDVTRMDVYDHANHTWYNNSRFVKDNRYLGSKNGYTDEALKTLIVNHVLDMNGAKRNVAIILLHGTDSVKDVKTILQYLSKDIEFLDVNVIK